ncbi:hypothetical protein AJ88_08540 [Mesorhizobium amorphae CCBAU 01583]|nr:hypothetical protein AJ88_08540 [Mesorhizobium amorphae CCBAU 01583]
MADDKSIFIGASRKPDDSYQRAEQLLLQYGNRHGLITGATGTGKTVSLQILAEGFSNAGVPVFCADIKGDLSGIAMMGMAQDFLVKRAEQVKLDRYDFQEFPVIFWDLFGEQGHPIRATISEMGPLLLSRLMNLSEAQEGIMNIAFRIATRKACYCSTSRTCGRCLPTSPSAPTRSARATAMSPSRRSAPSSARFWCWSSRGRRTSSASRRCTSPTSCAPRATGAAPSACWPPTS